MNSDTDQHWHLLKQFNEKGLATVGRRECDLERTMVSSFLSTYPLPTFLQTFFSPTKTATYSSDEWQLCSRAFSRLIPFVTSEIVSDPTMETWILAGMQHSHECMISVAVECISFTESSQPQHTWSSAIYHRIISLVAHPTLHEGPSTLILKLLQNKGIRTLVLQELQEAMSKSESQVLLRYLDIVSKSSAVEFSPDILPLLKPIETGLGNDDGDVLLQMNLIEFIPALCKSADGVSYVTSSTILPSLIDLVDSTFVGGMASRGIAHITVATAKFNLPMWTNNVTANLAKSFLRSLKSTLASGEVDEVSLVAAMDALGSFASASEVELQMVLNDSELVREWLEYGSHASMELKATCFLSVATVLLAAPSSIGSSSSSTNTSSKSISALNETLFQKLGKCSPYGDTMTLIMKCLRAPFEDIRVACYTLLRAVALQDEIWGVRTMFQYAGFLEFITDRSTEGVKVTKEWKFAVVDALVSSKTAATVLNPMERSKLGVYFSEGPYVAYGKAELDLKAI